jgi:beta-lactam-binding protein with PASTA domain
MLAAARCSTGGVHRAFSATVKTGRVVSEHPSAGTHLANGGKVNLVVSRGRRA